jgi:ornithine carbamoyltransferase
MKSRHFLTLMDLSHAELTSLLQRAIQLKEMVQRDEHYEPLHGKVLAMIFDKSSTRTRVSFQTGMAQLGGTSLFLAPRDTHLGRGEPIEDTARVLSRMVNAVVIRTHAHATLEAFATHASIPVINALTDMYHPCQLLADLQTYAERRGDIRGKSVAWIGDGNNVCHSWINAAHLMDFELRIATPPGYEPNGTLLERSRKRLVLTHDPAEAVRNADVVVTDTWASMGQENEKSRRERDFSGFLVNQDLMARAKADALFMHCLPAYRGCEVTPEVIDGPQSVVWDEAENRLHSQKALLELLLNVRR